MKNVTKMLTFALSAGSLLFSASCNEDFLNVDHYDIVESDAILQTATNLEAGLTACYAEIHQKTNGEVLKPNIWFSGHPTMDTQCTGWDKQWLTQSWTAESGEMLAEWKRLYVGISTCNDFLATLDSYDSDNLDPKKLKAAKGEAIGLRALYYTWLAQNWGRVPLLGTGENYVTHPQKAKAASYDEMWEFIIKDLKEAAELLDWTPYGNQYGRITKGMCLAYLADAYMWKAYRGGVDAKTADENIKLAQSTLKTLIDQNVYELNPSYTTLFDPQAWQKEAIWEECIDEGDKEGEWSFNSNAHGWLTYLAASPVQGGWGALYLSWEWYTSFEVGDKRRDASACTGAVDFGSAVDRITGKPLSEVAKSKYCYGINPYNFEILETSGDGKAKHLHYESSGDFAPSIWTLKYWRTGQCHWQGDNWAPHHIYWKRYAAVLLDYAECCFRSGDEATGWEYVEKIRRRAFGFNETDKAGLATIYNNYYSTIAMQRYGGKFANDLDGKEYDSKYKYLVDNNMRVDGYALPFGPEIDESEYVDGKTYYAKVKAALGFDAEVWQVALLQERRKEFNCEFNLRSDIQRSGMMAEHINKNYPKDPHSGSALVDYPWSFRNYDYNENKMTMPIPSDEIIKNSLCEQNEGY